MSKGNYIALQPSKPVEYKAGDYSVQFADWLIKRGDAAKAAKLKAIEEDKKYWNEKLDKIVVDPAYTRQNFQEGMDNIYQGVIDMKAQALAAANDPSLSSAQKQRIYQSANNAASQYKLYSTTLGSEDFLKRTAEAEKFISEGNADLDSMDLKQRRMLYENKFQSRLDNNGNLKFYLPKEEGSDEVVEFDLYTTRDKMMTLPETELLKDTKAAGKGLDSKLSDVAVGMTTEYDRNTDGNRGVSKKAFAVEKGSLFADTTWGKEFNETAIPKDLNAFFKRANGRTIQSQEDFDSAKKGVVDYMAALVPDESKIETKYTAEDMEGKRLANINSRLEAQVKKATIAQKQAETKVLNSMGGNSVSIPNATVITQMQDANGRITGVRSEPTNVAVFKSSDGKTTTSVPFGVSKYINKDGKEYLKFKVGGKAKDGNYVYSFFDSKEGFETAVREKGLNPAVVYGQLNIGSLKATTQKELGSINSNSIYKNTIVNTKGEDYGATYINPMDAFRQTLLGR